MGTVVVNRSFVKPNPSRWILALAGALVLGGLILLKVANNLKQDAPRFRLRELASSAGKPWAFFTVYAHSDSAVAAQ